MVGPMFVGPISFEDAKMLRKLVSRFEDVVDLPIEIQDICDALVEICAQDHIYTCPESMDTDRLQGTFTQYIVHDQPYGEPILVTLIVYPSNVDVEKQRAICAKELVHVCDKQSRKVRSKELLSELAEKVVGPFQSATSDPQSDIIAAMDILAQYQAMNLLFPKAARALARRRLESAEIDFDGIVEWVSAPQDMVAEMIDPRWEEISDSLIDV